MLKKRYLFQADLDSLNRRVGRERIDYWRNLASKRRRIKYGEAWKSSASLLEIAGREEREEAFKAGKMVFNVGSGKKAGRLSLDLDKKVEDTDEPYRLVMPLAIEGKVYTLRFNSGHEVLSLFELREGMEHEVKPHQFMSCNPEDMAHLLVPALEKRNIVLQTMRIATQHAIAERGVAVAENVFLDRFRGLFTRLGYRTVNTAPIEPPVLLMIMQRADKMKQAGGDYFKAGILDRFRTMVLKGQKNDLNNLKKTYRIVALDPETYRIKSFYFPIQ